MEQPTYECCKCDYRWSQPKTGPTECPICQHNYLDWINYEEHWERRSTHG